MLIPTGLYSGCFFWAGLKTCLDWYMMKVYYGFIHASTLYCAMELSSGVAVLFPKEFFCWNSVLFKWCVVYITWITLGLRFRKVKILTFPSVLFSDQLFLCVRTLISSLTIVTCINLTWGIVIASMNYSCKMALLCFARVLSSVVSK